MTNILSCKCKSEYQDARYGEGMRVHNHARKVNNGAGGWRCTVCEDVKPMAAKSDGGGKPAQKPSANKTRKQAEKRKSPATRPVRPTNQRGT